MAMTAELTDLQEKIISNVSAKHWNHVEDAWVEVMAGPPPPEEFHGPVIGKLALRKPERIQELYEPYMEELLGKGEGELVLSLIELILGSDDTQGWLRPVTLKAIREVHKDRPTDQVDHFIDKANLEDEDVNLAKSLTEFNDLLGATKGQVFLHRSWGLGIVRELDIASGNVIIDFQQREGQKMTLEGVRNFLERIPKDHLEARAVLDKEGLLAQAKENPAAVIQLTLKSRKGRIKVSDMKRLFLRTFMTDSQYKSFWNAARGAIKLDPWVEQRGSGLHAELVLRDKPQSFLDEIIKRIASARSTLERRGVLRDVRKHGSDAEITEDDAKALQVLFAKPVTDGALKTDAELLAHSLLFDEFSELFGEMENPIDPAPLLAREDVRELIWKVDIHELRRLALHKIAGIHEHWAEIFAQVMPDMDTRTATWMERELRARKEDHWHNVGIENIFARPSSNPELFTWAAKNLLTGSWTELKESLPNVMIMEEIFSVLSEIQGRVDNEDDPKDAAEAKNQVTKVRGLLNETNSVHFKKAIVTATTEEARRLMRTIRLHDALPAQLKHALETILINQHRDLRSVSRSEEEEERRRPTFHYTTSKSLDEQRELFSKLKKDTRDMAPIIEAARELGDLKENSEYHAAKDRQKLLMQQATELEDLIARARVVEGRDEEGSDQSRFGTAVTIRATATKAESRYTIMGIWEADLENGIISYLTPFGSQLLGRRVGDVFVVKAQNGTETEYEMLAIENVLKPAETH